MRPKVNEYYLAYESDIIRLLRVLTVKKAKPDEDREYVVTGLLIAGFTDDGECYYWNEIAGSAQGDIEELELGRIDDEEHSSVERLTKKNFKPFLRRMFGDWEDR